MVLEMATTTTVEGEGTTGEDIVNHVAKKRGRKPKGGKIIHQSWDTVNNNETSINIILHLKCFLRDLQPNIHELDGYDFKNGKIEYEPVYSSSVVAEITNNTNEVNASDKCDNKEIHKKLDILKHSLQSNHSCNKKSACFWCTCDFDSPPIYIPKYYLNSVYQVYGYFCSPECACSYLMRENVDSSMKFERYHLLNYIYGKVFDYTKPIKQAPCPFYTLDKYCGNLTIQEYRTLLKNDRFFVMVEKPLTRILPELHEENDDFMVNNKTVPINLYQIKKQKAKKNKNNIITENFGFGSVGENEA